MRPWVITLATSGVMDHARSAYIAPALARWPAHLPKPEVRWTPVATLSDPTPTHGCDPIDEVLVAVFSPTESIVSIHRAIDAMRATHMPGVILCDAPELFRPATRSHGILVESLEARPEWLAATLATLLQRQPAVEALWRELHLNQSMQAGLRGEMDKLHDEMNLAQSVQRDLLPQSLPECDSLDFGVLYRPVGYVSGDLYDVRRAGEDHIAFFVADAVGHGVPAALLTMVISRSFAMHGPGDRDPLLSPAKALDRLNREFCAQPTERHRFATAVYGLINTRTHEVVLAGAGHPPPLIISRDSVAKCETDGPLLGVFAEAVYDEVRFTLKPDQTLLLYTDGFEVAFPKNGAEGNALRTPTRQHLDCFASLLPYDNHDSLREAMFQLASILDLQAGSLHQADDVTALALRPTRPASPRRAAA